jgi:hypothetical protein
LVVIFFKCMIFKVESNYLIVKLEGHWNRYVFFLSPVSLKPTSILSPDNTTIIKAIQYTWSWASFLSKSNSYIFLL